MSDTFDLIYERCYAIGEKDAQEYGIYDNPYKKGSLQANAYDNGFEEWFDLLPELDWIGVDD